MRTLIVLLLSGLVMAAWAQDHAPITLTYQGSLADIGGVPVDGPRDVVFRMYAAPDGGDPVWMEPHDGLPIINGELSAVLGLQNELPGAADPAAQLFLGVTVGDDAEMAPRMIVGGAIRAQWAAYAEVAGQALDVRGRHIHPAGISVGDREIVDADGRWVGEPGGLEGRPGRDGVDGADGAQGIQGVQGIQGEQGPPGERGPQGEQGLQGIQGEPGTRCAVSTFESDGEVVPGVLSLTCGEQPAVQVRAFACGDRELCDGADTDCDGSADEGFAIGDNCLASQKVACQRSGTMRCGSVHSSFCRPAVDLAACVPNRRGILSAGASHTCALLHGKVKCWGYNLHGRLGVGDGEDRGDDPGETVAQLPPVNLGFEPTWIVAGDAHTCALRPGNRLKCWGRNTRGQLGYGDSNNRGGAAATMGDNLPSVDVGGAAIDVATGNEHTCALLDAAIVRCWGRNGVGQLGHPDSNDVGDDPNEMGGLLEVVDLAAPAVRVFAGADHNCALLEGGAVKCWGRNSSGQLGLGGDNHRGDAPGEMGFNLPNLALGRPATTLALGTSHSCALLNDGSVKCWGSNLEGQLGRAGGERRNVDGLDPVELGQPALDIVAGGRHTCAILADGQVKCWGNNQTGTLGQGDDDNRNLPVVVPLADRVAALTAGGAHTCAMLVSGDLQCWGYNQNGHLGLGDPEHRGDERGEMGQNLPLVDLGSRFYLSALPGDDE